MSDLNTLLKSLIERIRNQDFGLDFIYELVQLVCHILQWLTEKDEAVFAAGNPQRMAATYGLLCDLQAELDGNPVSYSGRLSNFFVKLVLAELIRYVLENLDQFDIPEVLKDAIKAFLEMILLREAPAAAPEDK